MVRPLRYDSGINLSEAEERYREVAAEFEAVRARYATPLMDKYTTIISEQDLRTLDDCIAVLLPLGVERSVQEQAAVAQDKSATLHKKVADLFGQISAYEARFENTGVTMHW